MERKCIVMKPDEAALKRATRVIADGGVVAFPTDTVYGLGCDLFNASAIQRIYEIKGRSLAMPLIAMFAEASQWTQVASSLPPGALAIMERWWPGPLTIIVPARSDISVEALGGGNTIGMRIPDHPIALQWLRIIGRPLATTSANLSGREAACTAEEVVARLYGKVDIIIDGGVCPGGLASTVLDCTVTPHIILREGPVTRADLDLPKSK